MTPTSLSIIAASILVKASLLLTAAAVADVIFRRHTSAATRHLLWTLTITGLLLMPALSAILPGWSLPVPIAPVVKVEEHVAAPVIDDEAMPQAAPVRRSRISAPVAAVSAPAPAITQPIAPARPVPWLALIAAVYFAVVAMLLARLVWQRIAVRRLARTAVEVRDREWVRLFEDCAASLGIAARTVRLSRSRERSMPMTFGTRRPVILLPAIADTWTEDRRRAVLLHELAHVARRDCLTQLLATLACALYWMHPGVWWVARRLRVEREGACDDRVLTAGTRARDYAGHLLDIAYSLGGGRAPALVVTMARPRQLEGRMLAVLDDSRNRATPRPRLRFAAMGITAALVLPLATAVATVGTVSPDDTFQPRQLAQSPQGAQAPQPEQSVQPGQTRQAGQTAQPRQTLGPTLHAGGWLDVARDALWRTLTGENSTQAGNGNGNNNAARGSVNGAGNGSASGNSSGFGSGVGSGNGSGFGSGTGSGNGSGFGSGTSGSFGVSGSVNGSAMTRGGDDQDSDGRHTGVGTWEFRASNDPASGPVAYYVQLTEVGKNGGRWSSGNIIHQMERLEGLTQAQLTGPGGPVAFKLHRDAGTFSFEGVFRNGVGAGTYSFAADPAFPDQLAKRGFGKPTADQQYDLARMDVGMTFLDELNKQGYQRPDIAELVRGAQHGVGLDYLQEMGGLGYKLGLIESLVRLRDHGVHARFIRDLANDGFTHLSPDDLVRLRDHGVSSDYLKALRDAGYKSVSLEEAIKARDHGVSADFIKEMGEMGYAKLSLDELIEARNHGVSANYAREMKALGYPMTLTEMKKARDHGVGAEYVKEMTAAYGKMSLDELINVRNHGVSTDYIREMKAIGYTLTLDDAIKARDQGVGVNYVKEMADAGYPKLPLDTLINARNHGVSTEFMREMKALGYTLSLDDAIKARDHGVNADFASSLKSMGYDRVALDELIALRDHGVSADRIKRANSKTGTKLPLDVIRSLADGGGLR